MVCSQGRTTLWWAPALEEDLQMLAYDYPLLGAFWTVFWIFIWVAWIVLLFRVIADIFRSHDMGGGGKALWSIFVIVLPYLGVFVYLIARGKKMGEHAAEAAQAQDAAMRQYVQSAAGTSSPAEELTKLADLKARGVIDDAEFERLKANALA